MPLKTLEKRKMSDKQDGRNHSLVKIWLCISLRLVASAFDGIVTRGIKKKFVWFLLILKRLMICFS